MSDYKHERVTLTEGDWINVKELSKDEIEQAERAFLAGVGGYGRRSVCKDHLVGTDFPDNPTTNNRQLTLDQVVNAENAKQDGVKVDDKEMLCCIACSHEWKELKSKRFTSPCPECGDSVFEEGKKIEQETSKEWVNGMPPVGVECEITDIGQGIPADELNLSTQCLVDSWSDGDVVRVLCHVVMHRRAVPVVQHVKKQQVSSISLIHIAPLRTHKERVIEKAIAGIISEANKEDRSIEIIDISVGEKDGINKLYDLGMLIDPNDKEGE